LTNLMGVSMKNKHDVPVIDSSVPSARADSLKMRNKLQELDDALVGAGAVAKVECLPHKRSISRETSGASTEKSVRSSQSSSGPKRRETPRNRRFDRSISGSSTRSLKSEGGSSVGNEDVQIRPSPSSIPYRREPPVNRRLQRSLSVSVMSLKSEGSASGGINMASEPHIHFDINDPDDSPDENEKKEHEQQELPRRPKLGQHNGLSKQVSQRTLLGMCGTSARRFSVGSTACSVQSGEEVGQQQQSQKQQKGNRYVCDGSVDDGNVEEPSFGLTMAVVSSWESVRLLDNYEEILAEQIILRMMELDSNVRKDLGLPSIRSPHFDVIKEEIMGVLDGLMSFLGPDLEDFYEEIQEVGHRYRCEGFKEYLFAPSVVEGIRYLVDEEDFPSDLEDGWNTVLEFLVSKMY